MARPIDGQPSMSPIKQTTALVVILTKGIHDSPRCSATRRPAPDTLQLGLQGTHGICRQRSRLLSELADLLLQQGGVIPWCVRQGHLGLRHGLLSGTAPQIEQVGYLWQGLPIRRRPRDRLACIATRAEISSRFGFAAPQDPRPEVPYPPLAKRGGRLIGAVGVAANVRFPRASRGHLQGMRADPIRSVCFRQRDSEYFDFGFWICFGFGYGRKAR